MNFNINFLKSIRKAPDDKVAIIDEEEIDKDEDCNSLPKPDVVTQAIAADLNHVNVSLDNHSTNPILNDQIKIKDELPSREYWSGKFEFLLSTLGYAVGLGNVWRFPYMCYKNGGGAFLIPYVIFLTLVAMPLFLVDVGLGQFSSNGPFTCWQYSPIFTGIGYSMVVISTMVSIYYNVIVAYALYYMFASMANPLPWTYCNNTWNTMDCMYNLPLVVCNSSLTTINGTCVDSNNTFLGISNETIFTYKTGRRRILPAEEFFNREVLRISDSISIVGEVQWKIAICLFFSWIMVFLCLIKGIKTSGKVVYFTALFPYIVLLILFFRGIFLDGALDGILFYIVPDIKKLASASVWKDAANQIFFSLSTSWGGLITLASYNKFHNNIMRDTFIISLGNSATSIFAGFVIFSYLGYLAKKLHTQVSNVAEKGMGLAFIIYPEAVATMPGSYFWSVIFFIMLVTLGLDSQFTTIETVITGFMDTFPMFLRSRKTLFIFVICLIFFLLGLPMTTQNGPYWLQLMDTYCGGWAVLFIAIFEVVSIGWVYGQPGFKWNKLMRFEKDIQVMLKRPISRWWRLCWQYITPTLLVGIVLFSWMEYTRATYGDKSYPVWADFLGWCMTLVSLFFIPGKLIYLILKERKINPYHTIKQILKDLSMPTYKWGPALSSNRVLAAECLEDNEDYYVDVVRRIKYRDFLNNTQCTENQK